MTKWDSTEIDHGSIRVAVDGVTVSHVFRDSDGYNISFDRIPVDRVGGVDNDWPQNESPEGTNMTVNIWVTPEQLRLTIERGQAILDAIAEWAEDPQVG